MKTPPAALPPCPPSHLNRLLPSSDESAGASSEGLAVGAVGAVPGAGARAPAPPSTGAEAAGGPGMPGRALNDLSVTRPNTKTLNT